MEDYEGKLLKASSVTQIIYREYKKLTKMIDDTVSFV